MTLRRIRGVTQLVLEILGLIAFLQGDFARAAVLYVCALSLQVSLLKKEDVE